MLFHTQFSCGVWYRSGWNMADLDRIRTKQYILFFILEFRKIGCNIVSKILFVERGKRPLKFTCPTGTSTCPATLLNIGELHCEDSAQNITCRVGHVRVSFCLADCRFFAKFTCNLQQGKWLCCCCRNLQMLFYKDVFKHFSGSFSPGYYHFLYNLQLTSHDSASIINQKKWQ